MSTVFFPLKGKPIGSAIASKKTRSLTIKTIKNEKRVIVFIISS